jgi:hypothetical protein
MVKPTHIAALACAFVSIAALTAAAFADTPAALKPAGATPIDAKISPQAKVEQQKAAMPPDATSVKQLNKDQDNNIDSKDQVKVDKDLHSKKEVKSTAKKSKKSN